MYSNLTNRAYSFRDKGNGRKQIILCFAAALSCLTEALERQASQGYFSTEPKGPFEALIFPHAAARRPPDRARRPPTRLAHRLPHSSPAPPTPRVRQPVPPPAGGRIPPPPLLPGRPPLRGRRGPGRSAQPAEAALGRGPRSRPRRGSGGGKAGPAGSSRPTLSRGARGEGRGEEEEGLFLSGVGRHRVRAGSQPWVPTSTSRSYGGKSSRT